MISLIADRYEIVNELTRDGARTSYLARDRTTDREVVVIQVALAADLAAADALAREAEALRAIDHPSVPALVEYRAVEIAREAMLVRARVAGEPISARSRTDTELVAIIERVLEVLAEIAPKVHGALAADHVFVDGDKVALVGFGGGAPDVVTGVVASDLAALAALLDGRDALRSVADALRAPSASFRSARAAIDRSREATANVPSADDVAAMREVAEADAKRASEREREARAAAAARRRVRDEGRPGRIRVDDAEGGTTITIGRGSSSWLIFFVGLPMLAVVVALPTVMVMGGAGLAIGLPILALFMVGLWHLTRPHRLLLTSRGDYVLHRGDPRRPVAIGRTSTLSAQITTFAKQGAVFGLNGTGLFSAWHPFGSVDVHTLCGVLRRYDVEVTSVRA